MELVSYLLFLQEQIKDIIIISPELRDGVGNSLACSLEGNIPDQLQ